LVEERVVKLKSRFVLARAMFHSHLDNQESESGYQLVLAPRLHPTPQPYLINTTAGLSRYKKIIFRVSCVEASSSIHVESRFLHTVQVSWNVL
jgi:hypothetical protein